jgi:hypothetical protein
MLKNVGALFLNMTKIQNLVILGVLLCLALLVFWDLDFEFGYTGLAGGVINYTGNWTMDGNAVYIDDSNVYIRASPHTLSSSGWIYFNLTSKVYTGNIDVVFGFNTTEVKPTRLELYSPITVYWNTTHYRLFYNVSSIQVSTASCEIGNEYNTYKRSVMHTLDGLPETTIVCFDSYENQSNNYTITWHTEHSRIDDNYVDKTGTLSSINYNYGGMNKWWYVKNVPITANTSYVVRGYVKVPVSLQGNSGKYWFAVKPSSETIQQAITNGHFYYLDPWWDIAWDRCKNITISSIATTTLTDFPVYLNVTYDSDMQSDYDDIRFLNDSCNSTATAAELAYEFVENTSTNGEFWVKIPSLPSTGVNISMYYGNTGASSGQNVTDVWDSNYTAVYHMNDNDTSSINDSTSNGNDGDKKGANEPIENGGRISFGQSFDGDDDEIDLGAIDIMENLSSVSVGAWVKLADTAAPSERKDIVAQNNFSVLGWDTGRLFEFGIYTGAWATADTNAAVTDTNWHHVVGVYNGSNVLIYLDSVLQTDQPAQTGNTSTSGNNPFIGEWGLNNQFWNGTIDEVRISNMTRTTDWINMSYQIVVDQTSLVSWGEEEGRVGGTFVWTNGGSTGIWEDGNNWNLGDYPKDNDDYAIFNGTSTADCNTTGSITVGSIGIWSGYTGTITLGGDLTVDDAGPWEGNISMYAGTLNANVSSMSIDGKFFSYSATINC